MNLLEIKDFSLEIGNTTILNGVNLKLREGQLHGLIGESGSGKSLTSLSVMQLLPSGSETSGSIRFDGREITALGESEMCDLRGNEIGMIFQEPMTALNPLMSIGDQVAETIRIHTPMSPAEAQAKAAKVLARVGLPQDKFPMSRFPHELSGGQRQRVGIAMAVALRPRILIADEPTTALDVATQAQILDLLKQLVEEEGMALLLITHDLAVVADLADEVSIMRHGEVVESGDALPLFTNMQHAYTKQLFSASTHVPTRKSVKPSEDGRLLEVAGLVRAYPKARTSLFSKREVFRAVNGVSFEIHQGENVGLVGESGCGKSTLARAILGLDRVQGGTIRLKDAEISAEKKIGHSQRRAMQVVFQDPYGSFNPRHRVSRLVAEPLHVLPDAPIGKERERLVADTLEEVGLRAEDTEKYIHEFSGGQRQRIAIARALIIRPSLIILDEAVSALDVSIRAQILDLLADLSDRLTLSYLFISHDLSVVRAVTDRVLVMQQGVIVEQGNTEELFSAPEHPYTRQLISAAPDLNLAVERRQHSELRRN
ncbi:MAG: dipeptide ABC transporter ATP-binding protein [Pseudomonadota bacterium]